MTTLTEALAESFSGRTMSDLPDGLVHQAKRLLIDYLGVSLSGSQLETGRLAANFAVSLAGTQESSLIGRGERVPAVYAAFANAVANHSLEYDDIDESSFFHYGAPVMSSVLAVGELVHADGPTVLTAAMAGCETLARLSRATNPALRDRGFHTTTACGVFGGTVAAGIAGRLSPAQLVHALGLAGGQACGLMEIYGASMQKRFNPGWAARNAVTAVLLARAGATAEESVIDGDRGFATAFAGHIDRDAFLDGLGRESTVMIDFKPYACVRPVHTAIDAVLRLRQAHRLAADDVEELLVYRGPAWGDFFAVPTPRSFHEAQVSLPYAVAVAMVEGVVSPGAFAHVGQDDAQVQALAERVVIKEDASLAQALSCRVVIRTRSGQEVAATVDSAHGSQADPLDDGQLLAKFRSLAIPVLGEAGTERLAEAAWKLDSQQDVSAVLRNAVPLGVDATEPSAS
jgi:2-methylcitrate dehydratase PrpD